MSEVQTGVFFLNFAVVCFFRGGNGYSLNQTNYKIPIANYIDEKKRCCCYCCCAVLLLGILKKCNPFQRLNSWKKNSSSQKSVWSFCLHFVLNECGIDWNTGSRNLLLCTIIQKSVSFTLNQCQWRNDLWTSNDRPCYKTNLVFSFHYSSTREFAFNYICKEWAVCRLPFAILYALCTSNSTSILIFRAKINWIIWSENNTHFVCLFTFFLVTAFDLYIRWIIRLRFYCHILCRIFET